jgi:hypothetical protein
MADQEERLAQIREMTDIAEGYISDADFREEVETKVVRYLQAIAQELLVLKVQNDAIIEALTEQD